MFYNDRIDVELRFGDVVEGFFFSIPTINSPIMRIDEANFNINLSYPRFSVVLSPCCSIKDKILLLAPLLNLRNTFYQNEYFKEDLTRINRIIVPEKRMPKKAWENISDDEKTKKIMEGPEYTFLEIFIYEEHEIFPTYEVNFRNSPNISTKFYMIDFRNVHKINCDRIIQNNNHIGTKILQLSVNTRKELRDKIGSFYNRATDEDKVILNIS